MKQSNKQTADHTMTLKMTLSNLKQKNFKVIFVVTGNQKTSSNHLIIFKQLNEYSKLEFNLKILTKVMSITINY